MTGLRAMGLREGLSSWWAALQGQLFPQLEDNLGPLTDRHLQIVTVLEMIRLEAFLPHWSGLPGRPLAERVALARSFVAKAVLNLPTTVALIERVQSDQTLRKLCGWARLGAVPSESTFSRAFSEFSASGLPVRVHEALIESTQKDRLVGHISRDSTAIEAREKPQKTVLPAPVDSGGAATMAEPPAPRKRGRPRKGEERPAPEPRRLERQGTMTLDQMLADLPKHCAVGTKSNAKGYKESWIGYKLHIDTADGGIPISCVLTSASLHDSQVAIPLATMTAGRVLSLYDLMDSAYDATEIKDHSISLGHVPIIAINPRRDKKLKEELAQEEKRLAHIGHQLSETIRYHERSSAERTNSRLKDEFGGRTVRVRGADKVMCHLMFGMLALTVDQLLRFVT